MSIEAYAPNRHTGDPRDVYRVRNAKGVVIAVTGSREAALNIDRDQRREDQAMPGDPQNT